MISQNEFNKLMETYENANHSVIYDIGLTLIISCNFLAVSWLVAINL
jgi:hypothetical protein